MVLDTKPQLKGRFTVWPKGILSDDYGLTPDQCRWVIGGADRPIALGFIPLLHPANVEVTPAPEGKALGPMLEAAFISAWVPQCILNKSPRVARLFPDYESVEREYYSRTGIFPIMHTVVVRKELLAQHPGLAQIIYRGFCDAKDVAMERYRDGRVRQHMEVMIPWFSGLFDENCRQFPDDWWPYGFEANRKAVDTFLRYHFEQGLSKRRLTCEDIFVPELLGT
jgi:4,5-dihydroxyphthalate decarboxylase